MMDALKFGIQLSWLIFSVASAIVAFQLRRSSLLLAKDTRAARYFKSQGQAWEATGVEIVSATARGLAGFYLPESIPVLLLLSVGLAGRVYQVVRLWMANTAINNGSR